MENLTENELADICAGTQGNANALAGGIMLGGAVGFMVGGPVGAVAGAVSAGAHFFLISYWTSV